MPLKLDVLFQCIFVYIKKIWFCILFHSQIICLQEVQENHFQERIYPALIEMGENIL